MVVIWRHTIRVLIIVAFAHLALAAKENPITDPNNWKLIESLAEEYPYVVALLSGTKDYICTGSIISKRSILTSGSCVSYEPKYVLMNAAMYNKKLHNSTVFEIAFTRLHGDYVFDLKTTDPNVTRMHSNIGLAFVEHPVLELFVNAADLGNYYASELKDKSLIAVGYGRLAISDSTVALQHQTYHQAPCMNPKWYYCVCGIEYSIKTYSYEFGTGAPVLYGGELVGITATPCGTLSMKNLGIKYNIFTVIGPYMAWIDKSHIMNSTVVLEMRASTDGAVQQRNEIFKHVYILLVISKAL